MNDYRWSLTSCDYVAHHGILGMHWGVRRYQNKDGSLTALGRQRLKSAQNKSDIKYNKTLTANSEKAYIKATGEYNYAQRKVADAKIQNKLDKQKKKSKYQLKMEEKYKAEGMSAEQAAIEAYKSDRTRKILMAAAGTAIAVGVAYGAYKYYDGYVDKFVKAGTTMQRIDTQLNPFDQYGRSYAQQQAYFAVGKADKARYEGLYGGQLARRGTDVFRRNVDAAEGFKVASDHSGLKALREVAKKDPAYMGELKAHLKNWENSGATPAQIKVLKNANRDIANGKITKDVYKAMNLALVDHRPGAQNVANKFYKQLASKGYRAVQDVNDRLLSGFNSDNPIIAFDMLEGGIGKTKAYADTVYNHKLDANDIKVADTARKTYDAYKNFAVSTLPTMGLYGSAGLAAGAGLTEAARAETKSQDNTVIAKYKKEHPGTKLSNDQILDNYYNY